MGNNESRRANFKTRTGEEFHLLGLVDIVDVGRNLLGSCHRFDSTLYVDSSDYQSICETGESQSRVGDDETALFCSALSNLVVDDFNSNWLVDFFTGIPNPRCATTEFDSTYTGRISMAVDGFHCVIVVANFCTIAPSFVCSSEPVMEGFEIGIEVAQWLVRLGYTDQDSFRSRPRISDHWFGVGAPWGSGLGRA